MIKFNISHNKTDSSLCGRDAGQKKLCVPGIPMLSFIAFAPVADEGCSAGNWDPRGFLNTELRTSQPVPLEELLPSSKYIKLGRA